VVKEKFKALKCAAFYRQLQKALINMQSNEAFYLLDLLEDAAAADRAGIIIIIVTRRKTRKTRSPAFARIATCTCCQ